MSIETPVTIRELKDYADRLSRETREIAESLAKETMAWRETVEVRLTKLEVKMNIIAFLAGTGAVAGIADLVRMMIH